MSCNVLGYGVKEKSNRLGYVFPYTCLICGYKRVFSIQDINTFMAHRSPQKEEQRRANAEGKY